MSLQKQIEKKTDKFLEQYQSELEPNWRSLPFAQKSLIAQFARNGITVADLEKAKRDGRKEAYEETAPGVLAIAYACMGCVLHDMGVSDEEVKTVIMAVDDKISLTIDKDEIEKELEDKCGLRIYTKEGVGRVEAVR